MGIDTLLLVGGVGCATLMLVYFALSAGQFGLGFALLSVGMLACVVLSYPMVITLERPVRMTPEQAVRDYYAALSHHRPHFRRMWLLLSTKGRSSSRFGSFEGFVKCWRSWLLELRGLDKNTWTPLHFDIHGMKAEKARKTGGYGLTMAFASSSVGIGMRRRLLRFRYVSGPYEGLMGCGILTTETLQQSKLIR